MNSFERLFHSLQNTSDNLIDDERRFQEFYDGVVVDRIRIKIWESASGDVIYDSQMGNPDHADPELIIAVGSITIH